MPIRNTSKALIVKENCVLLNRCRLEKTGEIYYDLPGGGQQLFETMEEAVIREVREETGYTVRVVRFSAVAEEINQSEAVRTQAPDYAHRMAHIFVAEITENVQTQPAEKDFQQEASVWVSLDEADRLSIFPIQLRGRISELVQSKAPVYLGTSFV